MSYTQEERQQIAAQVRAYMEAGKVHTWKSRRVELHTGPMDLPPHEQERDATTYEQAMLDLVARDVLQQIDHAHLPSRLHGRKLLPRA